MIKKNFFQPKLIFAPIMIYFSIHFSYYLRRWFRIRITPSLLYCTSFCIHRPIVWKREILSNAWRMYMRWFLVNDQFATKKNSIVAYFIISTIRCVSYFTLFPGVGAFLKQNHKHQFKWSKQKHFLHFWKCAGVIEFFQFKTIQ